MPPPLQPLLLAAALAVGAERLTFPPRDLSADPSRGTVAAAISDAGQQGVDDADRQTGGHGLSPKAAVVAAPFGFPITNSMIVTWAVAAGLILFAQIATRKMREVPAGAQNFFEWLVESLYGFLEGIIGRHLVRQTFWFFGTAFIFILAANWVGLLPGVGSIGRGHRTATRFIVDEPLFRGANADVNLTLAMALVFFAAWLVWGVREAGIVGFLKELFAPKGESTGVLRVLLIVVFFASGCLEVISILFRPISLSFRLYGNIFAGETMLETMARMPYAWLVQIPFYLLELLVGFVQALVFMLLTAVFTLLICPHEDERPVGHISGPRKGT
jgi:F-type H+-transporting ATPase subunit a